MTRTRLTLEHTLSDPSRRQLDPALPSVRGAWLLAAISASVLLWAGIVRIALWMLG